jgi:hypothetical protein
MKAMMEGNAEGGRIGYDAGGNYEAKIKELMDKGLSRELAEIIVMSGLSSDRYDLKKAQGGRIGYNLGGIGAMDPRIGYQMGSPHGQVIPTFSEGVEQMYESGPAGVPQITKGEEYDKARSDKVRQLILEKALELMQQTEGLSGFEAMDLAEEIVKKQIFVEKGGSEYAEYISEPELEGFSMRTTQELPTGPHSDWRRFQVRDYVEDDPLLRVQTEYMHSPIMEVKKPTKELEVAQGGRIAAKEGGIMPLLNLGGMEKDYRQDGGFVPIGRREKADDVPARLSKNEFVFTADAVRNAGGGDIDKGAQRMYNVMKNLEAGGEISEQSQGQV